MLLLAGTIFTVRAIGQAPVYENGLIYSTATMNKLEKIVDSLNLRYKSCDLNKVFYTKFQTVGHIVRLDTGNIQQAKKDMDAGLPLKDFVTKYPKAKVDSNVLVIRFKDKNYANEEIVGYREIDMEGYGMELQEKDFKNYTKTSQNTWLCSYSEPSAYSKESISAFYFPEDFKSIPLNNKYCRLIGYADCLIDTIATKFKDNNGEPQYGDVSLPENWQTLSLKEKERLLDELRSTRVMGLCSQDNSPVLHAINIALLSAETINWEIFLRSHLDVINDNFDRVAQSNVARAERNTYIKELEELDINVPDLLLGISFRVENAAPNHYFGSIDRLGKAIAESKDRLLLEQAILSMMEDKTLDDYNRILAYFLFTNYNYFTEDKTLHESNKVKLITSVSKLPEYLQQKIRREFEK